MEFKRYDGFYGSATQKKVDDSLPVCPFCGGAPHWNLNMSNDLVCMCEKCGGKLVMPRDGFSYKDELRVVDCGSVNKNGLMLNGVYHVLALQSMARQPANPAPQAGAEQTPFDTPPSGTASAVIAEQPAPQATTVAAATATADGANKPAEWNKKKTALVVGGVIGLIALVVLIVVIATTLGSSGGVTYKNFEKIEVGMTYSEVCDLMGGKGELESEYGTIKMYGWSKGLAAVTVTFQNNIVISKTQIGLSP